MVRRARGFNIQPIGILVMLLVTIQVLPAQDQQPDQSCIDLASSLDARKQHIWRQICEEKAVIFNADDAVVSGDFLRMILSSQSFKEKITDYGVHFIGARFTDVLDLSGIQVSSTLRLEASIFSEDVNLSRLVMDENVVLSLGRSEVQGELKLKSAVLRGDAVLRQAIFRREVDLRGLKVSGQFDLAGAAFHDGLLMGGVTIDGNVLACNAFFERADLRRLVVRKLFDLSNATVISEMVFDSAVIKGDLLVRRGNCEIDRLLSHDADWGSFGNVFLDYAEVGGNLDLSGAVFKCLSLANAKVAEELTLEKPSLGLMTEWPEEGTGCPGGTAESGRSRSNLELEGLRYSRIAGSKQDGRSKTASSEAQYFIDWIQKDSSFSLQPYVELASALRDAGKRQLANDVVFASREAERANSTGTHRAMLAVLRCIVGYGVGYRALRIMIWYGGLVLVGSVIFLLAVKSRRVAHLLDALLYSIDNSLPVVDLGTSMCTIGERRWVRYVFFFHRLVGYLLIAVVALVLTGILTRFIAA